MLVGNTLSPKIQATLNVGERRFLANAPLQALWESSRSHSCSAGATFLWKMQIFQQQVRVILETFCRDFKEEVQKRVYFYKSSRLASSPAALHRSQARPAREHRS